MQLETVVYTCDISISSVKRFITIQNIEAVDFCVYNTQIKEHIPYTQTYYSWINPSLIYHVELVLHLESGFDCREVVATITLDEFLKQAKTHGVLCSTKLCNLTSFKEMT